METKNNHNIDFICTEPGVESTMPIIRSSEHKPSWLKKAAADFKNNGSLSMNTTNDDDETFREAVRFVKMYKDKNSDVGKILRKWKPAEEPTSAA